MVDGGSTDGSVDLANSFAVKLLADEGEGLGAARNIGASAATKAFVLQVGPDNLMTCEAISQMVLLLENHHDFVGCQTRLTPQGYLARGTNFWRRSRFSAGAQMTIGTPSMAKKSLMKDFPYSKVRKYSDDSEICERLRSAGKSLFCSDAIVFETGYVSFAAIIRRWRMYGKSDYEVFENLRLRGEDPARLLRSLLHPLRFELLIPMRRATLGEFFKYLPFLMLITIVRYASWVTEVRRNSQK